VGIPLDGKMSSTGDSTILELRGVEAGYGQVTVLRDIDLAVQQGSITAVIGANGAGKTTLLKVISGLIRNHRGTVNLNGQDLTRIPPYKRGDKGICLIPEGQGIFRTLTVRENLRLFSPPGNRKPDIEPAVTAFPVLGQRLNQTVGTLSGGEQQMLAVARAYLTRPEVILFDELSSGLAPILLDAIFDSVHKLATTGVSLLIVEQYVEKVLALADTAYILVRGRISWNGPANGVTEQLLADSYLGGM
jgi:branched-chain amino acid transport system ATP-binding protein